MCGIVGLILDRPEAVRGALVERLGECLRHRGPDDSGVLTVRDGEFRPWAPGRLDALLLHRRLSILDLGPGGHQPMVSPDGRLAITFNGEIYNYLELRAELQRLGHAFHTRSDTEVLLRAYREWGSACLGRLVGMFALFIADLDQRKCFVARDFFGMKPLYHCRWAHGLAFASEIKALLELPGVSRAANPARLRTFLASGIADFGDATLFGAVAQVPAAHFAEIPFGSTAAPVPVRYWSAETRETCDLSFEQAAERVREEFLGNVALHLRSDVPVGAALSGGIDSSAVVAAIRHLDPTREIHTFTHVVDDPVLGEERWADIVSTATGARAHKVVPQPGDLIRDLEEMAWHQDQPFGGTSTYAQFRVFRLAREAGVKVLLDGQGADEVLGGYPFFRIARLAGLLGDGRPGAALDFLRACGGPSTGSWTLVRRAFSDYLVPRWITEAVRGTVRRTPAGPWVDWDWFRDRGARPDTFALGAGGSFLHAEAVRCLCSLSLPDFLRFEDRNSMAFSLESRLPFLTPRFVRLVLSLPESYVIARDGTTKAVFRRAMRGLVPDAVLDRRDKVGFATPEAKWLRAVAGWAQGVIREAGDAVPALKRDALLRAWQAVQADPAAFDPGLWRSLSVVAWTRRFDVTFD